MTPLLSASVIVLRDAPLEVLMLRRLDTASFVPSLWVFPGGVADEADFEGTSDTVEAMRVTAARELFEESGVWLGPLPADAEEKRRKLLSGELSFRELSAGADLRQLVLTSHWITPIGVPKRFDTYFFLAKVERDVVATLHAEEATEILWIAPQEALEKLDIIFPTRKNLEALAGFATADELIDSRRGADIPTIQPVIVDKKIRLP
ncbi:MAG TPA: NUDIX hydrolase [Thermoanaerobaculia bacterium]|nr:NUDIX hydrolase [Thermoanaerobaculia bacterium]